MSKERMSVDEMIGRLGAFVACGIVRTWRDEETEVGARVSDPKDEADLERGSMVRALVIVVATEINSMDQVGELDFGDEEVLRRVAGEFRDALQWQIDHSDLVGDIPGAVVMPKSFKFSKEPSFYSGFINRLVGKRVDPDLGSYGDLGNFGGGRLDGECSKWRVDEVKGDRVVFEMGE